MNDSEKVKLIGQMITNFWGAHDGDAVGELIVMLEMIGTVLDFGGEEK